VTIDPTKTEPQADPVSQKDEKVNQSQSDDKVPAPDSKPVEGQANAQESSGNQKVSAGVKQLLAGVSSDFSKLLPLNHDAQPTGSAKNPKRKVWVDTRKGFYYCPGDQQYGKTNKGTYMTQENAELNYYTPALMKPCP
jgi:hypothetical protein